MPRILNLSLAVVLLISGVARADDHPYVLCKLHHYPAVESDLSTTFFGPTLDAKQEQALDRFGTNVSDTALNLLYDSTRSIYKIKNCLQSNDHSMEKIVKEPNCQEYVQLLQATAKLHPYIRRYIALGFVDYPSYPVMKPVGRVNSNLSYDVGFLLTRSLAPLTAAENAAAVADWYALQTKAMNYYVDWLKYLYANRSSWRHVYGSLSEEKLLKVFADLSSVKSLEDKWRVLYRLSVSIPLYAKARYVVRGQDIEQTLNFGKFVHDYIVAQQESMKALVLASVGLNPILGFVDGPVADPWNIDVALSLLLGVTDENRKNIENTKREFEYGSTNRKLEVANRMLMLHPIVVETLKNDLSLCPIASVVFNYGTTADLQAVPGQVAMTVGVIGAFMIAGAFFPPAAVLIVGGALDAFYIYGLHEDLQNDKMMLTAGINTSKGPEDIGLSLITPQQLNESQEQFWLLTKSIVGAGLLGTFGGRAIKAFLPRKLF